MVEKASCLCPLAFRRITCTHSPFLDLLWEYLWYPKNLNVRDVDKRADISHLKSGRRSVLWNRQADLEIKFTGVWLRERLRGQVLSGNRGDPKAQYKRWKKSEKLVFVLFSTFPFLDVAMWWRQILCFCSFHSVSYIFYLLSSYILTLLQKYCKAPN